MLQHRKCDKDCQKRIESLQAVGTGYFPVHPAVNCSFVDVLILDNASIYTCKTLKPYWDLLEEKSMRFYFVPRYSPELNRIELLCHKI